MDTNFPYDDIVNLPHPTSKKHPRMSMEERAAQFSPFAALTGFGAVIQETGRLTGSRRGLTDSDIRRLEEQFTWLAEHEGEHPEVTVTYFLPDERKEGGEYATLTGRVKRLDLVERVLLLEAGERVPLGDIFLLETEE